MTFQQVIRYLIKQGYTQTALAEHAGCSQSNIARLMREPEAEPKYSTGMYLMDLYFEEGGR